MKRDWLGMHIYYASNSDPLLAECVWPMARDLRRHGLISRFFFIKYWLEGPHLRVRFLPRAGVGHDQIKLVIEPGVDRYLERRPALYDAGQADTDDLYRRMFLAEYSEERWNELYGAAGRMPFRPNNTYYYEPYEPEYDRYGGPDGVELSEWHFQQSSEIVLKLIETANVHVRTVLLGLSAQLTIGICYAFLGDDGAIADFLQQSRNFWQTSFAHFDGQDDGAFDRKYAKLSGPLSRRITDIRGRVRNHDRVPGGPADAEDEWIGHAQELRRRVEHLAQQGRLTFPGRQPGEGRMPVTDTASALRILLSSYVHMTNNRLGVGIPDEIYLSYMLERTLRDALPALAGS
jgi:hypothetical protein